MEEQVLDGQLEEVIKEPTQVEGQEPVTPTVADEPQGYKADPRYKSWGWEKSQDPINEVYKHLKTVEKAYTPFKQLVAEYGYKDDQSLKQALEEYKKYKDPENVEMQNAKLVNDYLRNDATREEVIKFFEGIAQKQIQAQYGNIPPEFIEKLQKSEQLEKQLHEYQVKVEASQLKEQFVSTIKDIEAWAKSKNLDFSDAKKIEFLEEIQKTAIPAEQWLRIYKGIAADELEKQAAMKAEHSIANNQKKIKEGVLLGGGKPSKQVKAGTLDEKLDSILDNVEF